MASVPPRAVARGGDTPDTPRISYVVARLDRAIRRAIAERVSGHGLTVQQYTTLSVLRDGVGLSNAQLARRSYITPQSMNEVIAALEGKKLLRRDADPDHGRIRRTTLTSKGRRVLGECDVAVDEMEAAMTADLSDADLAGFAAALRSCVHRLGAGLPGG